jgi:hypothetical protein
MTMHADSFLPLFSLCAHFEHSDELKSQIQFASRQIDNWQNLLIEAEKQGMAPLVNYHLRKSDVSVPQEILRGLSALALRHRLINQVRTDTLIELGASFRQGENPFLVLKGIALAHMLYPDPALRPMKDMDLLVKVEDCERATQFLLDNGFKQIIDKFFHPSALHLPTFSKEINGFKISIEVHHRLLPEKNGEYWGYAGKFKLPNQGFSLSKNVCFETINKEEFLYHLCRHTFFSYHNLEPLNMIWVADICNFAEKFKNEMDWQFIQSNYPIVQHTLGALHKIFPLSNELLQIGNIQAWGTRDKTVRTYQGWPGIPLRDVRQRDVWRWFKNTCFPSDWVLHLYYGNGRIKAKWYNWWKHVMNLAAITIIHMKIRMRSKHT